MRINRAEHQIKSYTETHQTGTLTIENANIHLKWRPLEENSDIQVLQKVFEGIDFGVQIADDGRVWISINGIVFLRFSPHPNGKMEPDGTDNTSS